ncbi:cyclin-dependent kinase inhibitor 1-like [Amphibalanus amphitrite]|uniref:cyclin-dependent kinase inhibitor 1-like n=1 Tax=Amphibalanus amphitrite TaxID=1232801 RepID=UPI001C925177|nr:cyclin-dependent kinase inhibitor 1-like [Amphibalanus amphitrite]
MLCPTGIGAKLTGHSDPWPFSSDQLWRMAPVLARRARRCRLAQFGGSPARRCLSEPLTSSQLSQFVKEEHAACCASDRRRYNFDFETMEPLEGRFLWEPVDQPPRLADSSESEFGCDSSSELQTRTVPVVLKTTPELSRPAPLKETERISVCPPDSPLKATEHTSSTDISRIGKRSTVSQRDGRRPLAVICNDRDELRFRELLPSLADETVHASPSPIER